MASEIVIWIIAFDLIVLFGLMIILRRLMAKGKINENKFAILACGYMSFLYITSSLPPFIINRHVYFGIPLITGVVIYLLIIWGIGYLWFRWVYRRINSRNNQ